MTLAVSVPAFTPPVRAVAAPRPRAIDVALLGLGHVGSAVAALALDLPESYSPQLRLTGALVRDVDRPREGALEQRLRLTDEPSRLLASEPDVVIEVLGGLEPARTIVLDALERGIPVITANKSLMAAHGDQLVAAAERGGTTLRYEASVLAGVPFLGTFANRPLAARISRVTGIVNGTTNFILTKMERERHDFAVALADAQARGFAEPNPANDIDGIDGVEKLAVLIRHFAHRGVSPAAIERIGIRGVQALDLTYAREFGGALKFIADAEWTGDGIRAFVGPTFVPSALKLSRIDGVENGLSLWGDVTGELFYSGPGAGPAVTAATILDDVAECFSRGAGVGAEARSVQAPGPEGRGAGLARGLGLEAVAAPATEWFVRLTGNGSLPGGPDITDLLSSFGVLPKRVSNVDTTTGRPVCYVMTFAAPRGRVERALAALSAATGCDACGFRSLER